MNGKDLIGAGRLSEARAQLTSEVKAAPSDVSRRTLLFQVLAFLGEWEKAGRHLDMIATLNPQSETGVQVYRNLIAAETERRAVMERKGVPGFASTAPTYLEAYLAARDRLNEKKPAEAARLYREIAGNLRPVSGSVDGKTFEGFSDMDAFLSLFLEIIVHDRYLWVPFDSIGELSISSPKSLFDLLWAPARLTTWEGLTMQCYIPVLYPDSFTGSDDRVRMGRMTEWVPLGDSLYKGLGQHMFQVGDEQTPLLEMREVVFSLKNRKDDR